MSAGKAVIQIFDRYQKERVLFVQSVADLATRPQNVEALMNAGVMALLRTLFLEPSAWTLGVDGGGVVGSLAAFSASLL